MVDAREPGSVVEAAEQAAAAGDYASAEQLLREAVRLQEASLGPLHPDLANSLNNLGVMCEFVDKPAEAEQCYRQAYAIAEAVLEPDHPFVVTSGKNLRDFRAAREKPIESPTPPQPVVEGERKLRATPSMDLARERPSRGESRPFAARRSTGPLVIGALSACALVIVMFIAARPWFSSNEGAGSSSGRATQPPPVLQAPPPEPLVVEPIPVPKETTIGTSGQVAERKRRATAPPALAPPAVADAQLCRDLSTGESRGGPGDWRCDPASRPVESGSLFFYTRLKSADDTTVQHRWFHADRLYQVVELRIGANLSRGYRTYSRHTMNAGSAGDWRVEVRTQDGTLLHEERFIVR